MKYIDMHVHVDSADKDKLDYLAETARKNETMLAMIGGLGYGERDFIPNEQVIEICKKYPDCFIPVAKLTLWDKADPAEVYHYAEMGARGFKCIYPYYEYDHDLYMPLYEAAEKCGMPILFHTGNYRPCHFDTICRRPMIKNMQPLTLDRIARSFQQLNIIMAHLGTKIFQHEAAEYIKCHANLYADLGGCGQWRRIQPKELMELLSQSMTEFDPEMRNFRKLVLGSDAYVTYPGIVTDGQKYYRLLLERIGVPQEIISDILGGTVAKWFGIELEH